jgi:hypothetical protein
MALRKSKIEILDRIIAKTDLIDEWGYGYWDDDYDYYDYSYCDNCGEHYCDDYSHCQTYEYEKDDSNEVIYVSRSFGRWHVMSTPKLGRLIDMNTIYSKEVLRQKKINYLLGIDKYEIQLKPTIGDSYNEKRRNI